MAIGSGGRAIKELQDRTGAHVMIYKPQPGDDRHMAHRPVMIKGRARAVAEAAHELRRRCRQYYDQMDERDRDRGRFRDFRDDPRRRAAVRTAKRLSRSGWSARPIIRA